MGIPYLKIQPEESIQIIDELIVSGYKLKEKISSEYALDVNNADSKIAEWRRQSNDWCGVALLDLEKVFVSQKELYNFRDAAPPFGATSQNPHYVEIVRKIKARIDKLNEYDTYIRNQFNVQVEVVMGSKITQYGNESITEINK